MVGRLSAVAASLGLVGVVVSLLDKNWPAACWAAAACASQFVVWAQSKDAS